MINKQIIIDCIEKLRLEINENMHLQKTSEHQLLVISLGYLKQLKYCLDYPMTEKEKEQKEKLFK